MARRGAARPLAVSIVVVVVMAVSLLAACSSGASKSTEPTSTSAGATDVHAATTHAVGLTTMTFVDGSRRTPANGSVPAKPSRTVDTTIVYPAEGEAGNPTPRNGAAPDRGAGPYPLVVFSHGFGESVDAYEAILERWAQAGYVVAAPHFPLTYAGTPGGINGADVEQQPGDVGFVITQMIDASRAKGGLLSGLVDDKQIAAAGHSDGGVTTVALVANSCCRDRRVKAALVLSGVDSPFSSGKYDLAKMPPVLFVHGRDDSVIGYDEAVRMFNTAKGPKALLTLEKANHGDWLSPSNAAFPSMMRATTDFLAAYARGDSAARARLADDQTTGVTTMRFVEKEGSTATIPTVPLPKSNRTATASATTGLKAGQVVTVSWKGFLPGKTVNIVQCTGNGQGGNATCDILHGQILKPDPTGAGSLPLTIHVGQVANGVCDATHPCTILVNDSGRLERDAFVYIPITFAG